MPRAPNGAKEEAKQLYLSGIKLADISRKLGVSEGTVRSWKNRDKWDSEPSETVAKPLQKNVAKKRGGQPDNNNALKHGAYKTVYADVLDNDEKALIENIPTDEEELLIEQIKIFTLRERKILLAINKYREQKGDVAVADVTRIEEKRSFKDEEEEAEYEKRQREKVINKEKLPGKAYNLQTHTTNKDLIIIRLEQELSSVQNKKIKAIEVLSKIRLEKAKLEKENTGNSVVDDWVFAAVVGEEDKNE